MKVAIAQIAPVLLNRAATLDKVLASIQAASRAGAQLVAFGETLVPAYPVWLDRTNASRFNAPDQKHLHALYLSQAVTLPTPLHTPASPSDHLAPILTAAHDCRISVILGVAERALDRSAHSIYCSRLYIEGHGPHAGTLGSVHRKLVPTYEERLAWAPGDGAGLVTHSVHDFTVGALNCWENWMPLARTALYAAGENLHVALWPGSIRNTQDITRFIALESRSFVLSASSLIRHEDIPLHLPDRHLWSSDGETLYDGGSCIAGPDGNWIIPPVTHREELLLADLDLNRVYEERQNFDPTGHYARPDVLHLSVNRTRQTSASFLP